MAADDKDAEETKTPPRETSATSTDRPPRNWAIVIIVGLIMISIAAAILLPLANQSLEKAVPAKAFLQTHFAQVRSNPMQFTDPTTGPPPDPERRAAYEAISRSTGEDMPWLPSVLGAEQSETLFCLEIPLRDTRDEKVSAIVVQKWSADRSTSTMSVTGLSSTRTCTCGEDGRMGCILN